MTLPPLGLDVRDPLARRWRYPFVWRARELSLDARSGQTGTLVRAAAGNAFDSDAVALTLPYYLPRWTIATFSGEDLVALRMGGGVDESLKWALPLLPRSICLLLDFMENGALSGSLPLLSLTDDAASTPVLSIISNGSAYVAQHHNGTTFVSSSLGAGPSVNDRVRLRLTLSATGVVQLHQSLNGAGETSSTASSALALASAWAGTPTLYLNSNGLDTFGTVDAIGLALMLGDQSRDLLLEVLD